MKRLIPPRTKEVAVIFKNFTWIDFLIMLLFIGILWLVGISNIDIKPKLVAMAGIIALFFGLILNYGNDKRGYVVIFEALKFLFRRKQIEPVDFKEATGITFDDKVVSVPNGYYSMILEISGIDFAILTEEKQDRIIQQVSQVYKNVKLGKIIKVEKSFNADEYLRQNEEKLAHWGFEREVAYLNGEEYKAFESRYEILENVENILNYVHEEEAIQVDAFYLVVYDVSKDTCLSTINTCASIFRNANIECNILENKEVIRLYKAFYDGSFDVDGNFNLPSVKEKLNHLILNGHKYRIASISAFPMYCGNAWLNQLFAIPGTRVSMSFYSGKEKSKVIHMLNKSIVELQSRYAQKNVTQSEKMDIENSMDSLGYLLQQLKMDNEMLHEVNYYILYPMDKHHDVVEVFKTNNLYVDYLVFYQLPAYMNMQLYNPMAYKTANYEKNLNTSTLSATFPFVSKAFLDPKGVYLGDSVYPVFFDLFHSFPTPQGKRTNANLSVFGKTGGGKSYFLKKTIMQGACEPNRKIFVLDPDNEYGYLCKNLHGNQIDVGGVGKGIINPLQVFPSLRDNVDEETEFISEVSDHRIFLQEWFKTVIPNLDPESEPFLNQAIARVYQKFNIKDGQDITKIKSTDFPTMDDLYQIIQDMYVEVEEKHYDYDLMCIRKLRNVMEDFKKGGVHSKLWNGHTTFVIDNDFTVLNFQSLFSNSNMKVANGQMLLILRFLMQEVIKNRNNNLANSEENTICICIDEAHRFINPKFPVALSFMSDMVKRIRKYGGSMIVATQNIKDFIGQTEETRVQASNVINGCQYSVIFGLMADDINSVKDLYRSYNGGLMKNEVDFLVDAQVGNALFMVDSDTRFIVKVSTYEGEEKYFKEN